MDNKLNSENVYGKPFKILTQNEVTELSNLYKIRFEKNKKNPKKIFNNKNCLDICCGFGRGSIFMAKNNAKKLTGVDVSKINAEITKKNLNKIGFKINVFRNKAEKIPFKDNTFDFVWCNGAIMHTNDPAKVVMEISRVLKPNGQSWIFVYGAGGLNWLIVNKIRLYLKKIKTNIIVKKLNDLKYSNINIMGNIDDWKVLNLRKYKNNLFCKALKKAGFKKVVKFNRGLNYDTSEKLYKTKNKTIYGEGDLRYLLTKGPKTNKNNYKIIKKLINKSNEYPEPKLNKYLNFLNLIFKKYKKSPASKIYVSGKIHYKLKQEMNKTTFDEKKYLNFLKQLSIKYVQ